MITIAPTAGLVPAGRMIGILLALFLLAAAAATTLAFGLFAALTAVLATLLELVRATPALSARSIEPDVVMWPSLTQAGSPRFSRQCAHASRYQR